jgi:hypothetical protein
MPAGAAELNRSQKLSHVRCHSGDGLAALRSLRAAEKHLDANDLESIENALDSVLRPRAMAK